MSPVYLFFTGQVLMEKTRDVSRLPVLYSKGTDGEDTRCQPCWGKAGRRWVGSYTVEEILKKGVYRLKNGSRNVLSSSVNSSRLKRYREADDDDNQLPASRRRYTYPVAASVLNPDPATNEPEKPHLPSGSGGDCTWCVLVVRWWAQVTNTQLCDGLSPLSTVLIKDECNILVTATGEWTNQSSGHCKRTVDQPVFWSLQEDSGPTSVLVTARGQWTNQSSGHCKRTVDQPVF